MRQKLAPPDVAVAATAAQQHGVITLRQLLDAGLSPAGVTRRLRAGRLHRIHRGVYAVGHNGLNDRGRWMAAVLACGANAVLSHRSAAALWVLLPKAPPRIDVSIPGRGGRSVRDAISMHRPRRLERAETTERDGIPVTTTARTLADLGKVASADLVRRARCQAEVKGLATDLGVGDRTRSELEARFLRLCRRHRLPTPEVNVAIGPWTVDFLWRSQRLVVETDGYRYHRGRQAFEDDHERDLDLRRRGLDPIRLSYRQVLERERAVAETLRAGLDGPASSNADVG
jgi:very-short-patch-repair endonuclease